MIKHRFVNKCNTIIRNSELNTGLNPVAELNAGSLTTRILIYFNVDDMKQDVKDCSLKTDNMHHILKMYNCGSVNLPLFEENISNGCSIKKRASSFDIIALKIPYIWDGGRGFDYNGDYIKENYTITSTDGSNWYCCQTGVKWDEPGIYSYETIENNESLIIGKQHFEYGTENLEIDITDYVNNVLNDREDNLGICLMFEPKFERGEGYEKLYFPPEDANQNNTLSINYLPIEKIDDFKYLIYQNAYYEWNTVRKEDKFISFFSPETNTFFNPFLETVISEDILDDRFNFHLGTVNRLYFFTSDNGQFFNLDNLPTCTINDTEYPVKQAQKGVYYAELKLNSNEIENYTILYDIWSNIVLNGEKLNDVELEFVALPFENRFDIGNFKNKNSVNLIPSISGIKDSEIIQIGDVRVINIDFIEEFSRGKKCIPTKSEYRIYAKEGNREIDIFNYQVIERWGDTHSIIIDSNDLIPNEYYMDVRVTLGRQVLNFEKILEFSIASNVSKYNK